MSRNSRILLLALAVILIGWLGQRFVSNNYLKPHAIVRADIERAQQTIQQYRQSIDKHPQTLRQIQQRVDRTLGGDVETVDAWLRTRLNRITEHGELKNKVVNTSSGSDLGGAKQRMLPDGARSRFTRPLSMDIDFVEVEGFVAGTLTLVQAVKLVEAIENEPWMKRIDEIRLDPQDNGERVNITLRLTTAFLPGKSPGADALAALDVSTSDRYADVALLNPFRLPPREVAQRPPSSDRKPAVAGGVDYSQWRLTGVAESGLGQEIWLLNTSSKQTKRLAVGERFHDLTLVAIRTDAAEFLFTQPAVKAHAGGGASSPAAPPATSQAASPAHTRTDSANSGSPAQRFFVTVGKNLSDRNAVVSLDLTKRELKAME